MQTRQLVRGVAVLLRGGRTNETRDMLASLLRNDSTEVIVWLQLKLHNAGIDDVEITGKYIEPTERGLDVCITQDA